jgi:hypothetical protein
MMMPAAEMEISTVVAYLEEVLGLRLVTAAASIFARFVVPACQSFGQAEKGFRACPFLARTALEAPSNVLLRNSVGEILRRLLLVVKWS